MGKVGVKLALTYKRPTVFSFVTKEVYQINHNFHCDSKYVIYLIFRTVCGLQYVGSTDDRFRPW